MESGLKNEISRWKRPGLYLTIPAIYLLVTSGILVLVAIFATYLVSTMACNPDVEDCSNGLPAAIILVFIYPITIVFVIPGIIGAIKLLQYRKSGIFISMSLLTVWSIVTLLLQPWSSYFWFSEGSRTSIFFYPTVFSLASVCFLWPTLILALKRVKWKGLEIHPTLKVQDKKTAKKGRILGILIGAILMAIVAIVYGAIFEFPLSQINNSHSISSTIKTVGSLGGVGMDDIKNEIYVANEGPCSSKGCNGNKVSVISSITNKVIKTITVESRPLDIDVNPQTSKIYVSNYNSGSVSIIDGTTNSIIATVPVDGNPIGVRVNTDTNKIYVGNYNSGTVSVINGTTNSVIKTIVTGYGTSGVAIDSKTNKIYATNANPFKTGQGTVSVIDGLTDSVLSTINVGNNPQWSVVNPNTNKIYVTNQASNTISVIDGATNNVISTIPVEAGPGGIEINIVTNKIYYPTASGTIEVIDGNTDSISKTISVGGQPDYLAINTKTNKIFAADVSSSSLLLLDGNTDQIVSTIKIP